MIKISSFQKQSQNKILPIGVVLDEKNTLSRQCLKLIVSLIEKKTNAALHLASFNSPRSTIKIFGKKFESLNKLIQTCHLIISIGGDGCILRCAQLILTQGRGSSVVLMGINAGHVGFLTTLQSSEIKKHFSSFLMDPSQWKMEQRACLEVHLNRKKKTFHVLNDCVVKGGPLARLLELEVFLDRKSLAFCRSDGIIVATPTASTAYNLAAGGVILEPTLNVFHLTPIHPQYPTTKPMVISDTHRLSLRLTPRSRQAHLTLDGQYGFPIHYPEEIEIKKSKHLIQFLRTPDWTPTSFFISLRQKLNWGLVTEAST